MGPHDCDEKENDKWPQVSVAANWLLLWSLSYYRASDSRETGLKIVHSSVSIQNQHTEERGRPRAAGIGGTVLSSAWARIQVISTGPCCNNNLVR